MLLSMVFFSACHGPAAGTTIHKKTDWIPWRAASGQYGFCTPSGEITIRPQYDDARPFHNGFAVVAKAGLYGVIDSANAIVIPLQYQLAVLWSDDVATLVLTKKEHNAWWQFWHWRILPEWNLLGGDSGPFLVTKVPRAKWEIRALPGKKALFQDRRSDDKSPMGTGQYWKADWTPDRSIPADLSIAATDDLVLVNHAIYQKEPDGRLRHRSGHFVGRTSGGTLLLQRGGSYYLADRQGQKQTNRRFTALPGLRLKTSSGEAVFVSRAGKLATSYQTIPGRVLKDQEGKVFLAPNLDTPFPTLIRDYTSPTDTLSAKAILSAAVMVRVRSTTSDYVVASSVGGGRGWRCFILQADGRWDTRMPLIRGVSELWDDGRIVFDRGKRTGVLDTNGHFWAMPLRAIRACRHHPHWYMGKDTATGKYGVYDAEHRRWQVQPRYSYLQDQLADNVAIYTLVQKDTAGVESEQFGLVNIRANREITPPVYDRIFSYGPNYGSAIRTVRGRRCRFYLQPETGREYREKETAGRDPNQMND